MNAPIIAVSGHHGMGSLVTKWKTRPSTVPQNRKTFTEKSSDDSCGPSLMYEIVLRQ